MWAIEISAGADVGGLMQRAGGEGECKDTVMSNYAAKKGRAWEYAAVRVTDNGRQ